MQARPVRAAPTRRTATSGTALIVELVLVATLAGLGDTFPRDVTPGTAWSFLATHGVALAHAVLGGLVLIHAAVLVRTEGTGLVSSLLAGGVAVAVAAGVWYVSGRQPGAALSVMTLGWLLALGMAVTHRATVGRRTRGAETYDQAPERTGPNPT